MFFDMGYKEYSQLSNGQYILALILGIVFTFLIYTLPIILYRRLKHPEPFEFKKASTIAMAYSLAAEILVTVIRFFATGEFTMGGAWLLWGGIDTIVLQHGWDEQVARWERERKASEPPVSMETACLPVIQSLMVDFKASPVKGEQSDFYTITRQTLHDCAKNRTVNQVSPEIEKMAHYVLIQSGVKTISNRKANMKSGKPNTAIVLDVFQNSLTWYCSHGFIAESQARELTERVMRMTKEIE